MDEDEAQQREAEHRAAALHNVGWETGAGADIWARAAQDELGRHESARKHFGANTANREAWDRLHGTALMLIVAVDQVLAFERRVRLLTGDDELAKARARFDAAIPHAEGLREVIAHLDAYAVGEGWRQTGHQMPPLSEQYVSTYIYWTDGGGTILALGDQQLNLRVAASAAADLAQVVERVRAKYLERAEQEANAALCRRFGLPPE
jgi:hypothetical protein